MPNTKKVRPTFFRALWALLSGVPVILVACVFFFVSLYLLITMLPSFLAALPGLPPVQIFAIAILMLICLAVLVLCAWGAKRTVLRTLQEIGVVAKDNFLARAEAAEIIGNFILKQDPFAGDRFSEYEVDKDDPLLCSVLEEFHEILADYEEYGSDEIPVKPEAVERLHTIVANLHQSP
jgi:hypothetical protein